MHDVAVVDASPLILLSRVGRVHLLRAAASRIALPDEVLTELRAKGDADATVRAVIGAAWIERVSGGSSAPATELWRLGAGESAVLAVTGRLPGAVAVLDDRAGRRRAEILGIPVFGTVGVVVRARRAGLLTATRPVLEELVAAGMHLSNAVLADVLRRVGE